MLSKANIRQINKLQQKKYRKAEGLFIVEGHKSVLEFLQNGFSCVHLLATTEYTTQLGEYSYETVSQTELKKISSLVQPQGVLAVFKIPNSPKPNFQGLIVALDKIQDPGNLGTIIRLCDWFGVRQLWCSPDTVDVFNSKTVQASMGSLARVQVLYDELIDLLARTENKLDVFGAFMDGENVYEMVLPKEGILVLGNEAKGISVNVAQRVKKRLSIPQKNLHNQTESLNVAMAAGILLSEFRRNY